MLETFTGCWLYNHLTFNKWSIFYWTHPTALELKFWVFSQLPKFLSLRVPIELNLSTNFISTFSDFINTINVHFEVTLILLGVLKYCSSLNIKYCTLRMISPTCTSSDTWTEYVFWEKMGGLSLLSDTEMLTTAWLLRGGTPWSVASTKSW